MAILKFIWQVFNKNILSTLLSALKWIGSALSRAAAYVLDRPALQRDLLFLAMTGLLIVSVQECRTKRAYADRYEAAQKHADSLLLENNKLIFDAASAKDNARKLQLRNDTLRKKDSLSVARLSPAERTAVNRQLLSELKP